MVAPSVRSLPCSTLLMSMPARLRTSVCHTPYRSAFTAGGKLPERHVALYIWGVTAPKPQSPRAVRHSKIDGQRHLVARISWAERLGLGSVEDHSPFGDRDFAGRWSRLLSPQASTGGKSG